MGWKGFGRRYALAWPIIATLLFTAPAAAQDQIFEQNGYTLYFNGTQQCSLFYDSPGGSIIYFGLRGVLAGASFNYVRPGLPEVAPESASAARRSSAIFEFNGNPADRLVYQVTPVILSSGPAGFGLYADAALLDRWASARDVRVLLSTGGRETTLEAISLTGSSEAILFAKACSRAFTRAEVPEPTVIPAPPNEEEMAASDGLRPLPRGAIARSDQLADRIERPNDVLHVRTPRGIIEVGCVPSRRTVGAFSLSFRFATRRLSTPSECNSAHGIGMDWVQFADQSVVATFQCLGCKDGVVVRISPQGELQSAYVEYMDEFVSIDATDRVSISASGVGASMQTEYWSNQLRIDWTRQCIIGVPGC